VASLIEELIGVLEEETGCYEKLLNMADNKKDVIIKGDVPSLQEITKVEQEMAGHILRLEKNRKQCIDDICLVLNKKTEDMTIKSLIGMLTGDDKVRLEEINEKLISIITDLQLHNEVHKKLIQQSLDFIDFTVNAVQSTTDAIPSNSYQAKGNRYDQYSGRNFFDAKQ